MNNRNLNRNSPRAAQHGAALVIGLILLLVLTLLAISGMNSASVEFLMAGNEQYQQNAFQTAEAGIEREMATENFVPGQNRAPSQSNVAVTPTESFTTNVTSINTDPTIVKGFSISKVGAYHFQIQSTGTSSVRNAQAVHNQGVMYISRKAN